MDHAEIEKLQLGGLSADEKFCRVERYLQQKLTDSKRAANEKASEWGTPAPDFGEYD